MFVEIIPVGTIFLHYSTTHSTTHFLLFDKEDVNLSFIDSNLTTFISYCRKSITVKGLSLNESVQYQQVAIKRYAELHQLELVKEYSDVGYSGKDTNRPVDTPQK